MYAGGEYRKFQEAGDAQEPVEEQQFGPREGEIEIFEGDPGYLQKQNKIPLII